MLIQDIILPKKYLTNKNCNMPAGHIALSCYFVTKSEFNESFVFTSDVVAIKPVDTSLPLQMADGSAATPSFSFISDVNTGMYLSAADTLAITTGGTQRATLSSSGLGVANVVRANSSSAANPTYSFNSDVDTGVWNPTANQIGLAAGGNDVVRVGTNGLKLSKTLSNQSTNINTTVASGNSYCGLITTQSASTVSGDSDVFTVTNSAVTGNNDVVLINIVSYNGTTGKPVVQLDNIGLGTFDVVVTNVDTTDPLNGTLVIAFVVL